MSLFEFETLFSNQKDLVVRFLKGFCLEKKKTFYYKNVC